MKFTCRKENLAQNLAVVSKAIPLKHSFPLLTNVLIEARDGRIKLSGTNLDTSITVFVGASIDVEGDITIPARHLLEFLSHLSDETITAELQKDILNIHAGTTKSKFTGIKATDYPALPELESADLLFSIDPKEFLVAVNSVAFSVASDETRPVFSGILVKFEEDTLTLAASDGYRLSERVLSDISGDTPCTLVLPAKTLLEIARIFGSSDEKLNVYLNEDTNLCLFQSGDVLVSSRLIDGAYPDYKRIIPKDAKLKVKLGAPKLLEAVKLTNVFTKSAGNALRILIDPVAKTVSVGSSSQELGENSTEVPAEIEGESMEVVFNAKYMLDFLTSNKYEKIVFIANDAASPCLIKPEDDMNFIHVLAPMQLTD